MMHRNIHSPAYCSVSLDTRASLRPAFASLSAYVIFVLVLITVLPGAGFGHV
jgi:hypothetical protein